MNRIQFMGARDGTTMILRRTYDTWKGSPQILPLLPSTFSIVVPRGFGRPGIHGCQRLLKRGFCPHVTRQGFQQTRMSIHQMARWVPLDRKHSSIRTDSARLLPLPIFHPTSCNVQTSTLLAMLVPQGCSLIVLAPRNLL